LRIHLTAALSHELEARLERGSLDAALLTQPAEVGPGMTWTAFCTEPLMVVAPASAPGKSDREILSASPFIRFKRYAWAGRLIDDELRRRGIEVASPMEVDSLEGILGLVAAGLGVSVVPRRNLAHPFPDGVRAVPFGAPPVTRSLGVLQPLDNPRGHFVRQLYDELVRASESPAASVLYS
jgi:DNA-binding transcriptional LysR family regulator